ncbi:MAG TPA: hypothetical protein VFU73_04315 [Actinocrinis sp.]|nr:hypothetical protein [Actinocrinis sp.]
MKKRQDPDLAALLAAAAAPDPERDGDERGLEAVLAAYREAADAPVRATDMMGAVERESAAPRRIRTRASVGRGHFTLALAVKCAAAVVVVAGAGMAAASVGVLPAPMQQFAHDYLGGVGIPAPPTAVASVSATPRVSAAQSATPSPTVGPTGSASASSVQSTPNELLALCEIVVEAGDSWHSDLDKAQRDLLIAAAGGNPEVPQYCDTQVANSKPSAPAGAPSPSASDGNGNANSGGNGNGKGHASKSPAPNSTKN